MDSREQKHRIEYAEEHSLEGTDRPERDPYRRVELWHLRLVYNSISRLVIRKFAQKGLVLMNISQSRLLAIVVFLSLIIGLPSVARLTAFAAPPMLAEYNELPEKIDKESLRFGYVGGWLYRERPPGTVIDTTIKREAVQWTKEKIILKPASIIQKPFNGKQQSRQFDQRSLLSRLSRYRVQLCIAYSEYLKNDWDVSAFKPLPAKINKILHSPCWRGIEFSDDKVSDNNYKSLDKEIDVLDGIVSDIYEPLWQKVVKEYSDWEAAHPEIAQQIRMNKQMEERIKRAEKAAKLAQERALQAERRADEAKNAAWNAEHAARWSTR